MQNEAFGRLVAQLSEEAENEKIENARLIALQARRDKKKQYAISGVVVMLYVVVYFNRVTINDTVAKLFNSKEMEYQSILQISDEIDAEKAGATGPAVDPSSRKAKLKNAMKQAKERAAIVDEIMDDAPAPAVTPAPAPTKK